MKNVSTSMKVVAVVLGLGQSVHLPHVCSTLSVCRLTTIGDGKCVICDSFVNPNSLVHVCDECNYGSFSGRCVVCGNPGITDAYYCRECVQQGKDREGCPKVSRFSKDLCDVATPLSPNKLWFRRFYAKIVNLGATKTDLFYERKKYGFKKR